MAFTNTCCRNGGSNLNAGTRNGNSTVPGVDADFTYASGNWVQATRVFTVGSGDPVADGIAVGDYVSVYADGSTVTGYVAQVTARTTTTITLSSTVKAGTAPTDGTGTRTMKVGGAWKGMNGADGVPFTLALICDLNSSGTTLRINMMNDAAFIVTASTNCTGSASNVNGIVIKGFTATYGDGGKFILDGGIAGATYNLFNGNGIASIVEDAIFRNNGATGVGSFLGTGSSWYRVVGHSCRFSGLGSSVGQTATQCEVYSFNQSASGTGYGIFATSAVNCFVHSPSGGNNAGFAPASSSGVAVYESCVAKGCMNGFLFAGSGATPSWSMRHCDVHESTSHGIASSSTSGKTIHIINCNILKSGGWGINLNTGSAGNKHNGLIFNCGFGTGTEANTSGNVETNNSCNVSGSISYGSGLTPWQAPATGDYRIALADAKSTGWGLFTQTGLSMDGLVRFPDIGAGQHLPSGSGGVIVIEDD